MTPSFSGRMAEIVPGVRPSIRLASTPTACTSPGPLVDRDDRRLGEDDPASADVDERVRRAEIDGHVPAAEAVEVAHEPHREHPSVPTSENKVLDIAAIRRRRARRSELVGDGRCEPGSALCLDRPRALVVRGAAAAGAADEARPRPASLPRQVRPAARRGLPPALLPPRRPRLRPVRRLGHDARRGERLRRRRGRLRHLGVQLPAARGQDGALLARRARARSARRAGGGPPLAPLDARRDARGSAAGTRRRRSAELLAYRRAAVRLRAAVRRRRARRPLPRCALGPADDALRPRLPARARDCARTSAASTSASAGRSSEARKFLRRYTDRHGPPAARVRGRAQRARRRASCTPTRGPRACVRGDGSHHLAAVPGADRLPRAAPLRVRAARARRPADARDRRGRGGPEPRGARALRRRP